MTFSGLRRRRYRRRTTSGRLSARSIILSAGLGIVTLVFFAFADGALVWSMNGAFALQDHTRLTIAIVFATLIAIFAAVVDVD